MNPIATKALKHLRVVKAIMFATVYETIPTAPIIDVMLVKGDGLYFLTARG